MSSRTFMRAPDYAKCFGIALVVFGHVLRGLEHAGLLADSPEWAAVDRTIYLFHMPLFFYLSGLFFSATVERRGYAGMLRHNAVVLLAPLVVWSYIQFSLQYVFSGDANAQLSLSDVLAAPFPPKQQFWFLGTLFGASLVAGLALRLPKAALSATIVVLLLGRFLFADSLQAMFLNPTTVAPAELIVNLPYFILGIVAGTDVLSRMRINNLLLLAAAVAALMAAQTLPFAEVLWGGPAACVCVVAIYKICMNIENWQKDGGANALSRAIAFIGMNSMIIYLAHVIAAAAFRALLNHMGVHAVAPHLIGGWVVGMSLPLALVPVGLSLQKYHPAFTKLLLPVRDSRQKEGKSA